MTAQVPRAPVGADYQQACPGADLRLHAARHSITSRPTSEAAERILSVVPEIRDCAWSNRGFHQRAATWIAEQGVRQFLDIGSGLPTVGNTHEVVRKIHPDARVVYVDNDPMVASCTAGELLAADRSTRASARTCASRTRSSVTRRSASSSTRPSRPGC